MAIKLGRRADEEAVYKQLIPNVNPEWVKWPFRKHRRITYYETQALTGHGSFRSFTKRIGKDLKNTNNMNIHFKKCKETLPQLLIIMY